MTWRLDNADAREWIQGIASDSVDLVLIDPPYYISRTTGFHRGGASKLNHLHADFGEWDKSEDEYAILGAVLPHLHRVLRSGGTIICFFDLWKITPLSEMMTDVGFKQLRFIEWIKANAAPINSSTNYLTNAREIALTGCKDSKPTFNSKHHNGMYRFATEHDEHRFHPTPKPRVLLEHLIRTHSSKGDLILDCFSGSGTTARACISTGRDFVGCEIEASYYDKSMAILSGIRTNSDFLD